MLALSCDLCALCGSPLSCDLCGSRSGCSDCADLGLLRHAAHEAAVGPGRAGARCLGCAHGSDRRLPRRLHAHCRDRGERIGRRSTASRASAGRSGRAGFGASGGSGPVRTAPLHLRRPRQRRHPASPPRWPRAGTRAARGGARGGRRPCRSMRRRCGSSSRAARARRTCHARVRSAMTGASCRTVLARSISIARRGARRGGWWRSSTVRRTCRRGAGNIAISASPAPSPACRRPSGSPASAPTASICGWRSHRWRSTTRWTRPCSPCRFRPARLPSPWRN